MPPEDQNTTENAKARSDAQPNENEVTLISAAELPRSRDSETGHFSDISQFKPDTKPESLSGKTVIKQRFILEELLGSGGMGTVYKARDLRKVEAQDRDPWLAIKLLNDDFKKHSAALISLQRESRKSQALTHPNIIKVFDFDRDDDVVFMTMEMLQGQSLKQHIQDNPRGLPPKEALRITYQMADALQHAHDSGIIHADFSPKNVFLTTQGEAKVLDFGIAQAIAIADTIEVDSDDTMFDPATLGGLTPGYASFEQLIGKKPIAADDVFALGCVVYQLLSGEHPFGNKTALEALSLKLRPQRVEALSKKQWLALQKAMSPLREERYKSVADFMEDFVPTRNPASRPTIIAATIVILILVASVYQAYSDYVEKQAHNAELLARRQAIESSKVELEREQALNSQQSKEELERINTEYLTLAGTLIAGNQFGDAQRYLDKVSSSMPEHPKLVDMKNQLTQSQLAYREQLALQTNLEIEVSRLLEKAKAEIAEGKLVRPPEDSAYFTYQELIALEPDNIAAETLQRRLVQLHIDGFNRSLQLGKLEEASVWLEDLTMIAPDAQNLSTYHSELGHAAARRGRIEFMLRNAANTKGVENAALRRDIYLQVLEIDPLNSSATRGLAQARSDLSGLEAERNRKKLAQREAEALMERAIQLLEKRPVKPVNYRLAYDNLIEALEKSPGLDELGILIEQLPKRYIDAIQEKIESQKYDEADELVQDATRIAPHNSKLQSLRRELTELTEKEEELVLPSSF